MSGTSAHILVGYDGSPESNAALRWAVAEARMRRLAVTVCHVWHWPYRTGPADRPVQAAVRRMAEQTAAAGAAVAAACTPRLTVRTCVASGPTAAMLLSMSGDAEAIVVGHRGGGGFAGLPVGSVAGQVAAHAARPVVVVRQPAGGAGGDVVAGIDGSAVSDAVLAFALEEAALRRVGLTAVCSWWDAGTMPVTPVIETEEIHRNTAVRFERLLALWREKHPYVPVRTSLVAAPPRAALLEASHAAVLLVVGRRGHGERAGQPTGPLGSVGQAIVHEASCPVAVVSGP